MKQGVAMSTHIRLCCTRADFTLCLLLPLLKTCLSIMSTSAKPSFKATCSKSNVLKATSTSHLLQATVRIQNMSIVFCALLYIACTSSRAWHKTMSAFMERQGFKTVGFEKSMWCRHDANGDKIMVGSHIDDFCICGTNRACLDEFRSTLLDPAKG